MRLAGRGAQRHTSYSLTKPWAWRRIAKWTETVKAGEIAADVFEDEDKDERNLVRERWQTG
jgi:hypothetical protein